MVHSTAVCDLLNSSIIFFINASIYMFVGLNMDRLHAIIPPLEYKSQAKQWTTIFFLVLAFLAAFICTAPFWVHHKMPKDGCYCQYPGFTDVSYEFLFDFFFDLFSTFQQFLRWWVSVVTFLIPLVMIILIWGVILAKLCKERTSKEVKVMDSQQPPSSRLSSQKRRWHKLIKSPPL